MWDQVSAQLSGNDREQFRMSGKNQQCCRALFKTQMTAKQDQGVPPGISPERRSFLDRQESGGQPDADTVQRRSLRTGSPAGDKTSNFSQSTAEGFEVSDILSRIRSGQLLVVNGRRRNGLILYKGFHAEFAGPGASVGGFFDKDCHYVIPVGDLSLISPDSHEDRQKAFLIRRQWIRLTQQFTDQSVPLQRAQMILNQFENYFDQETIALISDEAFALLVGALPQTVKLARRPPDSGVQLTVKMK